ncbi:MAG: sulfite oxidase [Gammaproteobacteria bacterium]|nr:sulfite oxidase [Gammaproteobacteria bacterium]MDH4315594.1 sulfite oxidase [Gammaproteobacteria bacterium]MDH5214877.1 sulfite oxidase [Gammaproteobacteria bacterium]
MSEKTRGLHELYNADPEKADELVWGRKSDPVTRRGFLTSGSLAAMSAAVGASIPFAHLMPQGLVPAALAQSDAGFRIPGKEGLIILNDRPVNAETPAHLLDDSITPARYLFVRNNGIAPATENVDQDSWTLEIGGESVARTLSLTIAELKKQFKPYTYQLQLECGGNGRNEFVPGASGNQWSVGAVGCPEWTGVRLADVLDYVGVKDDAVYVAYYGADLHLSGDPAKSPISRGVPMAKAMEKESLLVWAMNGESIPAIHGYPLRLVCGGWPGSVSGKWLRKIVVRNKVHDGEKMTGDSYRIPCEPVAPGSTVPDEQMCIIESMPVKSVITYPRSGIEHTAGSSIAVRGHAWAGDRAVRSVSVSIDFGATWQKAKLQRAANRLAWQHWSAAIGFPQKGYYEIWARATDTAGVTQPMVVPGWNPKGYLNNACHRIAVQVT